MSTQSQKLISILTLIAVVTTPLGLLFMPQKTKALISVPQLSVPVEGAGGFFDELEELTVDVSGIQNEIVQSAVAAAMNDAFRFFGSALVRDLEQKVGIKNLMYYQDALVEAKYLTDSLRKSHGEDAVPTSTAGDVVNLASYFEGFGLSQGRTTPEQAARAARRTDARIRDRNIRRMIAGATALFTPSISCAGVNNQAVQNAAQFLAFSSAGVLASEIRPESGITFYEQMARLGNPMSTSQFWVMNFQDNAAATEARARQAASLELLSPGIKASQSRDLSGRTNVAQSLNMMTSSQNKALASIFDAGIFTAGNSRLPSQSLGAFATYLAKIYAAKGISYLVKLFGGPDLLKKIGNKTWYVASQAFAGAVASGFTTVFVRNLYKRMVSLIYTGNVLAESAGCRRQSVQTAFTSGINTNAPIPKSEQDSQPIDNGIYFVVVPDRIERGGVITLKWDASAVEGAVSVNILGLGSNPLNSELNVTPQVSTTYTLEAKDASGRTLASVSRTAEVIDTAALSQVVFDVSSREVEKGSAVTIIWDASMVPDAKVFIYPLSNDSLSLSGSMTYTIIESTTFTLVIANPSDEIIGTKTIDVMATEPFPSGGGGVGGENILLSPGFRIRE